MTRQVTILGIGSTLMGDDAVGVRAAEALLAAGLPGGIDVVASGLIGLDLIYALEEVEAAVIIDAADFGGEPGEIRVAAPDEIEGLGIERLAAAHSIGLVEALTLLRLTGADPDIRLVCVQPGEVAPRDGLTPALEAALPAVCRAAVDVATSLSEPEGESM